MNPHPTHEAAARSLHWAKILLITLILSPLLVGPLKGQEEEKSKEISRLFDQFTTEARRIKKETGLEAIDSFYLQRLRALEKVSKEPAELAALKTEIGNVECPQISTASAASMAIPNIARLRRIYDANTVEIRKLAGPQIEKLNSELARSVADVLSGLPPSRRTELIQRFEPRAELAGLGSVFRLVGEVAGEKPGSGSPSPDEHKPEGETPSQPSLLSFSILQEQLDPPKPHFMVPRVESLEELEKIAVSKEYAEDPAARVVGTFLPEDTERLGAEGLSRTLLIFSGEGEKREPIGSLFFRGAAELDRRTKRADGSGSALELMFPDEGLEVPRIGDGEAIILEKQKEFPGAFEVRAGTSTISVRGTRGFFLPRDGNVWAPRDRATSRELMLIAMDGDIDVSGFNSRKDKTEVDLKHQGMLSLSSMAQVASFFEHTSYSSAYNDHLRYYPNSKTWLVTDFDADNTFGPLVHCSAPVYEPGSIVEEQEWSQVGPGGSGGSVAKIPKCLRIAEGGAILSFPPITSSHYRYLSFDASTESAVPLLLSCGKSSDPSDGLSLHFRIRPAKSKEPFQRVVIDLDSIEGFANSTPVIDTISFSLVRAHSAFKIQIEADRKRGYEELAEEKERIRKLHFDRKGRLKQGLIIDNIQFLRSLDPDVPVTGVSSGWTAPLTQDEDGKLYSAEELRAYLFELGLGSHSKSVTLPSGKGSSIKAGFKRSIDHGITEFNLSLESPDLLAILTDAANYGEPGYGLTVSLADIARESEIPLSDLNYLRSEYKYWPSKDRARLFKSFSRLHDFTIQKLVREGNPQGKPIKVISNISVDTRRKLLIHCDGVGNISRPEPER